MEIPSRILAGMITPLYWLFAVSLMNDWDHRQRGLGKTRISITGSYLAMILLAIALHYGFPSQYEPVKIVLFYLSYLYRLVFLILALYVTLSTWRQDLVEARRRMRLLIVGIGVTITLVNTLFEFSYGGAGKPQELMLVHGLLLLVLSLGVSMWLLFITPDGITASVGSPATAPATGARSGQTPRPAPVGRP